DGGLDVLDSDVEGIGQELECLPCGKSFGVPGLPPDVCGHRHVRSSSKGAGAESCGGAQTSQVVRSPAPRRSASPPFRTSARRWSISGREAELPSSQGEIRSPPATSIRRANSCWVKPIRSRASRRATGSTPDSVGTDDTLIAAKGSRTLLQSSRNDLAPRRERLTFWWRRI